MPTQPGVLELGEAGVVRVRHGSDVARGFERAAFTPAATDETVVSVCGRDEFGRGDQR